MASSSSSTVPSSQRTSRFISQTEMEMESSKARHWSQLDYSTTDSEWSAETNFNDFDLLKEDPQWGRFFRDFETLEVGEKISGGAQADIYEARMTLDGPFNLVVKVMKGDGPLEAFQAQWPIGMLSACSKYKRLFDENTIVQMHVIDVVAEWSVGLLGVLSRLLVATNFRVHSAGCWTREGRVECIIHVKGARMGTLLGELRHNMEYFPVTLGRFKIIVHRVAAEEFSHFQSRRLHDLKSMDFTLPRSSSSIRVHQRKECEECYHSTEVVLCFEINRWLLVDVSRTLGRLDYKIVGASVEYPGPYEFLKGRANRSEDIDVETLGEDEWMIIQRIRDVAIERGCLAVNVQLIVSGPSEEMHDDLMRCFSRNGLFVTGGQVCFEFGIRRVLFFLDPSSSLSLNP